MGFTPSDWKAIGSEESHDLLIVYILQDLTLSVVVETELKEPRIEPLKSLRGLT